MNRPPGLAHERLHWEQGRRIVVGVDEVGRGSWAGPLTVAAVVIPPDRRVRGIRDSKQLTPARREQLFDRILGWVTAWGVGHASPEECDDVGMSEAQRRAARRALESLGITPDAALVDGKWNFVGLPHTTMLVGGDRASLSIATASIIAKVTRDRLMQQEAEHYPAFAFDQNKGYPCPRHKIALQGYGPTPIHRRSWVFMDGLSWRGVVRIPPAQMQPSLFG